MNSVSDLHASAPRTNLWIRRQIAHIEPPRTPRRVVGRSEIRHTRVRPDLRARCASTVLAKPPKLPPLVVRSGPLPPLPRQISYRVTLPRTQTRVDRRAVLPVRLGRGRVAGACGAAWSGLPCPSAPAVAGGRPPVPRVYAVVACNELCDV